MWQGDQVRESDLSASKKKDIVSVLKMENVSQFMIFGQEIKTLHSIYVKVTNLTLHWIRKL